MRSILIVFFLSLTVVSACNKRAEKLAAPDASAGTYFSIIQFADDQFRTYWGQPFSLVRVENRNGKTDSTILGANQIDWAGELKPFFNADISDPAFLGRYQFSTFEDDITDSRTFYYEAMEPELFTRNMQITADQVTNKVKSIYIETNKDGRVQKLYYAPIRLIQIQEFESSLLGGERNLRLEYRFLY